MPSINRGQRYLALPLIGALVCSGLLVGSAGTASAATVHSAPVTSAVASTVSAAATATAVKRKKERRKDKIRRAVRIARNQLGEPYVYGAAGPNAFDCSGLTSYAFGKAGLNLSRTSSSQPSDVRRVSKRNVRRGDLIFFTGSGGVYHVAIYLGRRNGQRWILHASRSGTPVKRDPIWTSSWFAGTKRVRG